MSDIGKITPYSDGWAKISNLFDHRGDKVTDVFQASAAVAYVLTGLSAGMWVSWEVTDPEELANEVYFIC